MLVEILTALLCIYALIKIVFRKNKFAGIPGPKGWPIIGNSLQLDKEKPHVTLWQWAKEHGPVYKVNLGGTDIIVVTGTRGLHQVLVKDGEDFADRDVTYRLHLFSMNTSNVVLQNYDAKFKYMKKLMFKGLKLHNIKNIEDITTEILDDMLDDIRKLDGKPFNPSEFIFSLVFQIVYAMVFSKKIEKTNKQYMMLKQYDQDAVEACSFIGPNALLDLFPWLRFFGHNAYKMIVNVVKMGKDLHGEWKRQVESGELEGGWFKEVLEARKNNPDVISEENAIMIVMDFFGAGTATTSSTMLTFLAVMAQYPEVQKTLQDDVDNHVKESGEIRFGDRDKMPYTFACVLETLRYVLPVPMGVPHQTRKDVQLLGYNIPKGAQVITNFWGHHHDPSIFPDPYVFHPERFLDSDGMVVTASESPRKDFFVFGAGARVCAGETLAVTRLFVTFARLVQHFTIMPATTKQEQPSIHPETGFKFGNVLYPLDYKIRMVPRT